MTGRNRAALMGDQFGFLALSSGTQYRSLQTNYTLLALLGSKLLVAQTLLTWWFLF